MGKDPKAIAAFFQFVGGANVDGQRIKEVRTVHTVGMGTQQKDINNNVKQNKNH